MGVVLKQRLVLVSSLLLSAAIGAVAAWYFLPEKLKIQTEIVEKERIVYKDRVVTRRVVEVKKPDGTIVTSTTDQTQDKDLIQDVDTRLAQRLELIRPPKPLRFGVAAMAQLSLREPGLLHYGVQAEMRLIGPIWIGVHGLSNLSGGISLGFKW